MFAESRACKADARRQGVRERCFFGRFYGIEIQRLVRVFMLKYIIQEGRDQTREVSVGGVSPVFSSPCGCARSAALRRDPPFFFVSIVWRSCNNRSST